MRGNKTRPDCRRYAEADPRRNPQAVPDMEVSRANDTDSNEALCCC